MVNYATFKREYGLILVGAIVFTASFLWRDLLSDIKDIYFPKYRGIAGRTIFTILVTVILVILAIYIRDLLGLNQPTVTAIRFDDSPLDDENDSPNADPGTNVDPEAIDYDQGLSLSDIMDTLGLPVDGGVDQATASSDGINTDTDSGTDTISE